VNGRRLALGFVAIALLGASACSKGAVTITVSTASATPREGDIANGQRIFRENCAACHGTNGTEGGVGPSLRAEHARKNFRRAVAFIENPEPPMPKLYPGTFDRKAVDDVAAYVETL